MWSKGDIKAIRSIRSRSAATLNDCAKFLEVVKDCGGLSSGTIATLTGKGDYETIDRIQSDFVTFVSIMIPKYRYRNWMEAWDDFEKRYPEYAKA